MDGTTVDVMTGKTQVAEGAEQSEAYDVVLRGISHFFGRNQVLDDVNLAVGRGQFFGILGPSGSGKTTTLRIIGGFVIPTAGDVYIQNERMGNRPPYRRNTTMVFQHLALFPHMTVFNNLAYGLKLHHVPRDQIKTRVTRALEVVHLAGFEARWPKQLSGGQQQRVALARALVLEPSVVLFDEPLGSLDLKLRREMQIELKTIQRRLGTTFVYVTHDQQEAIAMCDQIAVMNEGQVVQVGSAEEIYAQPRTRFIAEFIGDINFLDGQVLACDGRVTTIESAGLSFKGQDDGRFQAGDSVTLCVRPERLTVGHDAGSCDVVYPAEIADLTYAGPVRRCLFILPNGARLKADLDAILTAPLQVGDQVNIGWNLQDGYVVAR
jgi:ABC-type Fe3+/spermidine/putrescine transport system ATPase subunit